MIALRAVRYDSYGPPEVLRLVEVPVPTAGPGEVLVEVHAAGVHAVELQVRAGKMRLLLREPPPRGLGGDFAGRVEAVGDGVRHVRAGDRVWGVMPHMKVGSVADFVVVRQDAVVPAPPNIGLIEAAALPAAGTTALRALTRSVQLSAGDRLLVRGASGAVGAVAVQLGRAFGAHVTALAGSGNLDLVTALGAHVALDYRIATPAALDRFDVVLDLVGTQLAAYRKLLAPRGRLIALAHDPEHMIRSFLSVLAPRTTTFTNNPSAGDLRALARYVEQRLIRPVVGVVMPMEAAAAAHRRLEQGGVPGRLVLSMGRKDRRGPVVRLSEWSGT